MDKHKSNNDNDEGLPQGNLYDNLKKENPFHVPEGYFDSLPGRIAGLIQSLPGSILPVVPLYRRYIFRLSVAAAIAIILITSVIFLLFMNKEKKTIEPFYYALTIEDLDSVNFIQNIDEYTLISYYLEKFDQTRDNSTKPEAQADGNLHADKPDTVISNDDIKQYLIESNEIEQLLYDL